MITDINGDFGPSVIVDLDNILTQGNITTQSITTSSSVKTRALLVNNNIGGTSRIISSASALNVNKIPDAVGDFLLDTSAIPMSNMSHTLFISSSISGVLTVGVDSIFIGSINAIWTIPSPVNYPGRAITISNLSAASNLNIDVVGGGSDIFIWGAPTINTNVIPNSTIIFKSNGTYWYACS